MDKNNIKRHNVYISEEENFELGRNSNSFKKSFGNEIYSNCAKISLVKSIVLFDMYQRF